MIRIKNRAMVRIPGTERKHERLRNGILFSVMAAGAAVMAGVTGAGYVTVLAADEVEQDQVMAGDDSLRLTGGVLLRMQMIPDRCMILKIIRQLGP